MATEVSGRGAGVLCLVAALALVVAPVAPAQAVATQAGPVDEGEAEGFVHAAAWQQRGTAVDFPDHVVFPADSLRALEAMEASGAASAVDPAAAAEAAARVQGSSGGFLSLRGELLGPWTDATGAGIALATAHDVAIDEDAAESFLRSMQNPDGGFAPRKTVNGGNLGSRPSSTFHAALGLQGLDALDGETADEIVGFLQQTRNADGGWAPLTTEVHSWTSATSYAVRTLAMLDALDPATEAGVVGFLQLVEDPLAGGFEQRYTPPSCLQCEDEPPSVPATGQALLLIDELVPAADVFDVEMHATWLGDQQIEEGRLAGSFPLFGPSQRLVPEPLTGPPVQNVVGTPFPTPDPPVTHHARNTALALSALAAHDALDALDEAAATSFLAATQHPGTGGFGWWPGYLEDLSATAGAYRALDSLDAPDRAMADRLAATLGAWQSEDGAIEPATWDHAPRIDHTAHAIDALAHADRLTAIDEQAAATFLASAQGDDGAIEGPASQTLARTSWLVVNALDHLDRLDELDEAGLVDALAGNQQADGRISGEDADDPQALWDTAMSLRVLATLEETQAVDVDGAAAYLADAQAADGSFPAGIDAAHVVLALASIDRLDAIDASQAEAYLADQQTSDGGLAAKGFYIQGPNTMVRHALALEALDALATA